MRTLADSRDLNQAMAKVGHRSFYVVNTIMSSIDYYYDTGMAVCVCLIRDLQRWSSILLQSARGRVATAAKTGVPVKQCK